MISRDIEIINKLGLHARASAKLTQLAGKFQCEVWMSRNQKRVNAKSIMDSKKIGDVQSMLDPDPSSAVRTQKQS